MPTLPALHSAPFLLPALHPDVPPLIFNLQAAAGPALLARLFVEAGIVHRRDLGAGDPLEVVRAAVEGWLHRSTGPLRCVHPGHGVGIEADRTGRWLSVELANFASGPPDYYVGAKLEALEQAVPGLGAHTLAVLDRQTILPLFTPRNVYETLVSLTWYGEEDEHYALDAGCRNEAERDEMREGIICRDDFDAAYPEWATGKFPVKLIGQAALDAAAHLGGATACVAAAASELQGWDARYRDLRSDLAERLAQAEEPECQDGDNDDGCWFIGHGALLHWKRDDIVTGRCADDFYHNARGSEADNCSHRVSLPFSRPDLLRCWFRLQRVHNRGLRTLDRLLVLLTEGQ